MYYELESPLLDPVTISKETWHTNLPQMESELNDSELDNAVKKNKDLMVSLKWGNYIKDIIGKLNTQIGILALDPYTNDIDYKLLAKAIDRYQGVKKITGAAKGVLDIDTWSELQDDLGFFDFRYVRINTDNAVKANKYYRDKFWGNHINFILQYFVRQNIIKYELPLNGKYFALAVAKWQAQDEHIRNIPNGVDGILGTISWDILRTEIEAVSPPYEVRAHIKMGDTKEAARRFVEVMVKLGEKIKNNLINIQTKVGTEIANEKQESSVLREGIYLFVDTLLDVAGETPVGKMASYLGKVTLGMVKKHYEEKGEEQRRQQIIQRTSSFADVILQASNAVTYLPDQTVIQHSFDDTILSIRQINKGGTAEKEVQAEFNKLLDYIITLENTVNDDRKVMRIALSNVMNLYAAHSRIFVHCQNTSKDIEDWEEKDVYHIINDPDRQHLYFYFTNVHPRVGAEEIMPDSSRKMLNILWGLWTQYQFPLNQLLVEKDVFLRVNFFERVHSYSITKSAVPYDVYVKSIGKNESSWTDANDVLGRIERTIYFRKGESFKKYDLDAANSEGLKYKNAILEIVNKVMQEEYNSKQSSKLSYIDSEVSETSELSEVYGSYEVTEIQNETIAEVFSRQQAVASTSTFLSVAKSKQATEANKLNVSKSGLNLSDIISSLDKYIDYSAIRNSLFDNNKQNPSSIYNVDPSSTSTVDAAFTEAVHQFQIAAYIDPGWQDGVIGPSTLDTLGLTNHKLKQKLNSSDYYGQHQLNRSDVKGEVAKQTNGTYTASNWFDFIVRPAWLGIPITSGVHILLLEKLRQAEAWLLSQSKYAGMTPATLGRALGFNSKSTYSAARLSSDNQAMHGLGLAIDINVWGNPWIGAGWISNEKVPAYQERFRMIQSLKKASGNSSLTGSTIFAYLDSIARTNGDDTSKAYQVLKQKSNEFVSYVNKDTAENNYWKASYTFGGRDPKDGFLNLHQDLVYALREVALLAWGAMDFGPRASGDIMHFDTRTIGVGQFLCKMIGGYVPVYGHPSLTQKTSNELEMYSNDEYYDGPELHEAIGEAKWGAENEYEDLLISDEDPALSQENNVTTTNWIKAVRYNRNYSSSLGWGQYINAINDLLLPYSGSSNISLGDEAFAQALASWQSAQGFSANDSDGILGPATWKVMRPLVVPKVPTISLPSDVPPIENIADFNRWHAQKIIDNMNAGILGSNFHSKDQLQSIVNGEKVISLDPQSKIVQILPVMYHISEQAKANNDNEIAFGSFIRQPDSYTSCTGHCAGNCIDINHIRSNFESHDSTLMVLRILNYLTTLPSVYKHNLGFGMPLQGEFYGHSSYRKFHSVPASKLINPQLQQIVPTLGIVFPDNDNHLHIQVFWK